MDFFRSQSYNEAMLIFKSIITNYDFSGKELIVPKYIWFFLTLFIISDILLYNNRFDTWMEKIPFVARWSIYSLLIFSIIVFSGVDNFPFIYFQF